MRVIAVAVTIASFATTVAAQNVAGLGAVICREVLPHMDNRSFQAQLFAWATGFMTGVNMTNQANGLGYRDFTTMKMDVILGEVRAACARNPELPIVSTIERMYQQFPVRK
ncbi:hypothetical protein ACU8OS_35430 (plasmid) [Rhizobium leguminosarum]